VTSDTIVDEVRAIRDAIAREHDYDLASICRALREEARAAGIQTVSLPARPVSRVASETAAQQAVAPDESGSSAAGSRS
jgi:rRNA-processing protein FCF1